MPSKLNLANLLNLTSGAGPTSPPPSGRPKSAKSELTSDVRSDATGGVSIWTGVLAAAKLKRGLKFGRVKTDEDRFAAFLALINGDEANKVPSAPNAPEWLVRFEKFSRVLTSVNLQTTVSEAARRVRLIALKLTRAKRASVYILDKSGRDFLDFADPAAVARYPSHLGLTGKAVTHKRTVKVDSVMESDGFEPSVDCAAIARPFLAVPLFNPADPTRVVAVVAVADKAASATAALPPLTSVDEMLVGLLARHAAGVFQAGVEQLEVKTRGLLQQSLVEAAKVGGGVLCAFIFGVTIC
jgi:hypothetical protein